MLKRVGRTMATIAALSALVMVSQAGAVDKLVVKDGSGNPVFDVTDSGQVGLGTTTPEANAVIHVQKAKSGPVALRVENPNIIGANDPLAQEQFVLGPNSQEHMILQVLSDSHASFPSTALMNCYTHDFAIRTNAQNVFKVIRVGAVADTLVLKTGNAGVGTSAPSQKLEVNGGVRLNTASAKPACDANARGTFWVAQGATDTVQVCVQTSTGLAWKTVTLQ